MAEVIRDTLPLDNLGRCHCGRATAEPYTPDQCRLCWLAVNDPRYRKIWNISPDDLVPLTRHRLAELPAVDCCGGQAFKVIFNLADLAKQPPTV